MAASDGPLPVTGKMSEAERAELLGLQRVALAWPQIEILVMLEMRNPAPEMPDELSVVNSNADSYEKALDNLRRYVEDWNEQRCRDTARRGVRRFPLRRGRRSGQGEAGA